MNVTIILSFVQGQFENMGEYIEQALTLHSVFDVQTVGKVITVTIELRTTEELILLLNRCGHDKRVVTSIKVSQGAAQNLASLLAKS